MTSSVRIRTFRWSLNNMSTSRHKPPPDYKTG
jgi:hypothetical protein